MSTYNTSAPHGDGAFEQGDSKIGFAMQTVFSFTKKVEILRALELTVDQFEKEFGGIKKLPFATEGSVEKIDLQLMEDFKKVYSLGTDQLESFISALDEAGEDLDEHSILYYISLLENGPYEGATATITGKDKGIDEITVDVF